MSKNVSRETFEKLKIYQHLLEEWGKKVNLVSASTLPSAWERHFEDSLQLLPFMLPRPLTLVDLGSGAGFPGLVLAIARTQTLKVTLVESDFKKCLFLENVSRETFSPVTILNERIENLVVEERFDVVTSRGLGALPLLLDYAFPLMKKNAVCLFLKGKEAHKEIQNGQKKWEFNLELFRSLTDSSGSILKITHPKRILAHDKNHCRC